MRHTMLFAVSVFLFACGPTKGPVTTVGASIFTSDVITVVAENHGGGFVPPPPAGSACALGAAKYTLTVGSKFFDWTRCVSSGMNPYTIAKGSRTLTDAEYKNLVPYLENLTVVAGDGLCGADKGTLDVTITTPSGQQIYGDSFYSCSIKDKPLVRTDALDRLFSQLYTLAM
ncbi:MAG TPA: hypothetical protein PKO07_07340 [Pseudomonadota bacterium]|nr:hypothetical protein [Pseudomonadota bacterium]